MTSFSELAHLHDRMAGALGAADFDAAMQALRDTHLLVGSAPIEHRQSVREALAQIEPHLLQAVFGALDSALQAADRAAGESLLTVAREVVGAIRGVSLRMEYRDRLRKAEDRIRQLPVASVAPAMPSVPPAPPVSLPPTADAEPARIPRPAPAPRKRAASKAARPEPQRQPDPRLAHKRAVIDAAAGTAAQSASSVRTLGGRGARWRVYLDDRDGRPYPMPDPGRVSNERQLLVWLRRFGLPPTRHGVIRLLALAGLRLAATTEVAALRGAEAPVEPVWLRDHRDRLWLPVHRGSGPGYPRRSHPWRSIVVVPV